MQALFFPLVPLDVVIYVMTKMFIPREISVFCVCQPLTDHQKLISIV